MAHHADYLDRRDDHALCGAAIVVATTLTQADAVCPDAREADSVPPRMVRRRRWRPTAEVEALRAKYGEPAQPTSPVDTTTAVPEETGADDPARPCATRTHEALPGVRRRRPLRPPEERDARRSATGGKRPAGSPGGRDRRRRHANSLVGQRMSKPSVGMSATALSEENPKRRGTPGFRTLTRHRSRRCGGSVALG